MTARAKDGPRYVSGHCGVGASPEQHLRCAGAYAGAQCQCSEPYLHKGDHVNAPTIVEPEQYDLLDMAFDEPVGTVSAVPAVVDVALPDGPVDQTVAPHRVLPDGAVAVPRSILDRVIDADPEVAAGGIAQLRAFLDVPF